MANLTPLEIELTDELMTQQNKFWRTQPITGVVGCVPASVGNTQKVYITIKQDGEFISEFLTISCLGPVNALGQFPSLAPATPTCFPSGRKTAANIDMASRGILLKFTDTGSGRQLTDNFIPAELIGTPGYGNFLREPFPFRYGFRKEAKLEIDIVCNDIADLNGGADAFHAFSIAMIGKKYSGINV